jgi:geranylgeranyl diphosphate synthase type II
MKAVKVSPLDLVEARLIELTEKNHPLYPSLFEAAKYSLLLPAKRFRPLLLLSLLEDFQIPLEVGIDPACALELIHTYSLIHDDLPCMDDDDFRRGKPSLHRAFDEAQAVLAGDYLLTYAFEILVKAPHICCEKKIQLIERLSSRAGAEGMIGGQVLDMTSQGKRVDSSTLNEMFSKKTGALLGVALEFGAILADLNQADQHHLYHAGIYLGVCYQYIDDLLDEIGDEREIGKPLGSDKANKKASSLTLFSKEKVKEEAYRHFQKGVEELSNLSSAAPRVLTLFEKCFYRTK